MLLARPFLLPWLGGGMLILASAALAQTPAQMRAQLEKIIAQHPQDLASRIALANLLSDQDDRAAARAAWIDAQKLAPESGSIAQAIGESELGLGNIRPALAAYQRATELEPKNALHHFSLANILFVFRRAVPMSERAAIQLALDHFRQATRLDPLNEDYARAYAETFYAVPNADWSAAGATWEHVLELAPKKDYAWLNLARVRLRASDPAGARVWLGKITDPALRDVRGKLEHQAAALVQKGSAKR